MRRREFITLVGGAAAWPIAARAQQSSKIPVVGILWHGASKEEEGNLYTSMHEGFAERGYVAGKNIVLEERFPGEIEGRFERFANELVALNVDVLVAVGTPSILAAQKATKTIPIVFVPPQDPITLKLTTNLARPDSNLTGLTTMGVDVAPKRVQLLKTAFPYLLSVAMLFDPVVAYNIVREVEETRLTATNLGMSFESFEVRVWEDIKRAFQRIVDHHLAAVIVAQGPMFFNERRRIAQLAIDRKLPTMAASDVFSEGGFLMSYGADWPPLYKAVPSYVDKLLKGAKPADLPIQQPTSFELIINMQTAQSIGAQIPASLQLLANRVIDGVCTSDFRFDSLGSGATRARCPKSTA
jgi:putative ABC transport system substrate-binding protein